MKKIVVTALLTPLFALGSLAEEAKPAGAPADTQPGAAETSPAGDTHKEVIGVIPAVMQYDKKEFTVKPGQKVAIMFINKSCPLQHNLIILKPGTDQGYGRMADEMIQKDPAAALKAIYQPESPNIVAKTSKLVGIGQHDVISFTAPTEPGDYPYVCTFPGHRFLMKGVMHVKE